MPDPSTLVPLMVLMFVPDTSVSCADKADLAPGAVLEPVPPFATGRVPVTPVVSGRPVAFVSVPEVGVPKIGVTSVGLVDRTTLPVPVEVVTPVPPFATGSVPVTFVAKFTKVVDVVPVPPEATGNGVSSTNEDR